MTKEMPVMFPTLGRLARIIAVLSCFPASSWGQTATPPGPAPDGAATSRTIPNGSSADSALTQAAPAAPAPGAARRHDHGHRTPAQVLDDQVKALTQELQLTVDQQRRARDVLIQQRMALLELRKNGAQDKVAASHAVFQRAKDEMRALLTPEQRAKYFVDAPEEKLSPAQVDRDYWLSVSRTKSSARPAAGTQAGSAAPASAPPAAAPGAEPAK
jgi:hypothetical protein